MMRVRWMIWIVGIRVLVGRAALALWRQAWWLACERIKVVIYALCR